MVVTTVPTTLPMTIVADGLSHRADSRLAWHRAKPSATGYLPGYMIRDKAGGWQLRFAARHRLLAIGHPPPGRAAGEGVGPGHHRPQLKALPLEPFERGLERFGLRRAAREPL